MRGYTVNNGQIKNHLGKEKADVDVDDWQPNKLYECSNRYNLGEKLNTSFAGSSQSQDAC